MIHCSCPLEKKIRAFGDKSVPPSLPDGESEGQETNGEESDVDEKAEEVEEEQIHGDVTPDQACSGTDELSLTEKAEEEGDKGNEEEGAEQDDQKITQGIRMIIFSIMHIYLNHILK